MILKLKKQAVRLKLTYSTFKHYKGRSKRPFLLGGKKMNVKEQQARRHVKLNQIGQLARQARQNDKLSIRDLSEQTGYTSQLIYAFENGHSSNMVILFDCYFCKLRRQTQKELYKAIRRVCRD